MAHCDYDCCALCDRKVRYNASDSRTKEDICVECMRALHGQGVMVYTGADLEAWINANQALAPDALRSLGYEKCFYGNMVDVAMDVAARLTSAPE